MALLQNKDQISSLARSRKCPRCDFDKTFGTAICSSCRRKLPPNMRVGLEAIEHRDPGFVSRAMRAAAQFFEVHFRSIRDFGGGKKTR